MAEALPSPSEPEGPIIDIIKSLLKNEAQQNIVLTNTHLSNILQNEFYMDTGMMHKFEEDVYVNVLKRYFKEWPEWDTLKAIMDNLEDKGDKEGISKMLKEKYVEIKEYLSKMLDIAQELAREKLVEINLLEKNKVQLCMEVEGTAQQLRGLFIRCPVRGSIFNKNQPTPPTQIPKKTTFESILNWFGVELEMTVQVDGKYVTYKRKNLHKLAHKLINKKLKVHKPCLADLKTHVLMKGKDSCVNVSRDMLITNFKQALNSSANTKWGSVSYILEKIIIDDLNQLPESMNVSCDYRRHISEQKYFRYFTQEVLEGDDSDKYDLHLEEVVSPLCEYSFRVCAKIKDPEQSITLTCIPCQIKFISMNIVPDIMRHFHYAHMTEPDWKCLKCYKVFTMCFLTQAAWNHDCAVVDSTESVSDGTTEKISNE